MKKMKFKLDKTYNINTGEINFKNSLHFKE